MREVRYVYIYFELDRTPSFVVSNVSKVRWGWKYVKIWHDNGVNRVIRQGIIYFKDFFKLEPEDLFESEPE